MEGGAAAGADPAAAEAAHDDLVGSLDGDHMIEADARLLQSFGLGDGAGHPVQNIALGAVGFCHPLHHDADDDLVGDQLARVHIGLSLLAHLSALLDGGTEHISRGDGRDIKLLTDDGRLGAFAGPRRAQENQFHQRFPPLTQGNPCSDAS